MTTIGRRTFLGGAAVTTIGATLGLAPSAWSVPGPLPANPHKLPAPGSLDGRPLPAFDFSRANRIPREMNGYWVKSFDVGGVRRTARVYLPSEVPIRAYYTVIAVPDGVDTETFLWKSTWRQIADERNQGLFVLEPGPGGWGSPEAEAAYVTAALRFYESNGYFSIFGLHYFVGYDKGAAALETYAVANPLKIIAQVYLDSPGLPASYYEAHANTEYDGTTAGYTPVTFPPGFTLIRKQDVVLPTWYIGPRSGTRAGLAYWQRANDVVSAPARSNVLGRVFHQRPDSQRWMTVTDGPISQVAVLDRSPSYWNKRLTGQILDFMTEYTRYENFFAYGNTLHRRADIEGLGIEFRTMMVEGEIRSYMVHVPAGAAERWGGKAPVMFVWPGNTQTDLLFQDATQWWKTAEAEGVITVFICEQYTASPISVSHKHSRTFFLQLRDLIFAEYPADPTRVYSTGQSAGSMVSQVFSIAFPEYFAAVAATAGGRAPDADGTITLDNVAHPASGEPIPQCFIYGQGDLANLYGTVWDDTINTLDQMVLYHLGTNGLTLDDVDSRDGERFGFMNRYQTWRWRRPDTGVPVYELTLNHYRSHNTIPDETPMLWEYARHFSREIAPDGEVRRFYSPSGFTVPGDAVRFV